MINDYLRNEELEIVIKKQILSGFYKSIDQNGSEVVISLNDGYLTIKKEEAIFSKIQPSSTKINNEDDDYEILLSKLQCNRILMARKPDKINPFKFYQWRLLYDWLCRYPFYEWREILLQSNKTMSISKKLEIQVKLEIYKHQPCFVCKKDPIQYCAICKLIYYCSSKCQISDWQKHKLSCVSFEEKVE